MIYKNLSWGGFPQELNAPDEPPRHLNILPWDTENNQIMKCDDKIQIIDEVNNDTELVAINTKENTCEFLTSKEIIKNIIEAQGSTVYNLICVLLCKKPNELHCLARAYKGKSDKEKPITYYSLLTILRCMAELQKDNPNPDFSIKDTIALASVYSYSIEYCINGNDYIYNVNELIL